MPWPKPEPQPKPGEDALYDDVDWMTFTHQQLYDMAHQGVDVAGANAVAAKWAKLGEALQDIADELSQALAQSVDAWQGEAADQARGSIAGLSAWSREAGVTATDVSGCVSIEANNAENAKRAMPEPVDGPRVHIPAEGSSPNDAFVSAIDIVRDPHGPTRRQHAAHQEAARVMQQFQQASQEVYGTVPQFSPPETRGTFRVELPNQPEPPAPVPDPKSPVTPLSSSADTPRGPAPAPPPVPAPAPSINPGGTPATPAEPAPLRAGPGAGVTPPAVEETRPAQRGGTGVAASGGGMAPMGGMAGGGAGKEEDQERKAPRYLDGDPDVFRIADRLAPPVIGEEDTGA
ncbi:MAG: hypothetical protein ABW224_00130 [Kibdelosporangium sp.]